MVKIVAERRYLRARFQHPYYRQRIKHDKKLFQFIMPIPEIKNIQHTVLQQYSKTKEPIIRWSDIKVRRANDILLKIRERQ